MSIRKQVDDVHVTSFADAKRDEPFEQDGIGVLWDCKSWLVYVRDANGMHSTYPTAEALAGLAVAALKALPHDGGARGCAQAVLYSLWRPARLSVLERRMIFSGSDGFNLGCFTWTFRRFGPVLIYREMLCADGDPPPLSGWKVALLLTPKAWFEFYEGLCK